MQAIPLKFLKPIKCLQINGRTMSPSVDDWDSRLEDHLKNEQSRNEEYAYRRIVFGEHREHSGGNFHAFLGRNVLLNTTPDELNLEELHALARYLCNLTLQSENSEIGLDHFKYWSWTGAVASYARLFEDTALDEDSLGNLCLLIQLALLINRNNKYWKHDAYWNNGSYMAILIENYNLVTIAGYPILEGLLRRHCKELKPDGTMQSGHSGNFNKYVNRRRAYLKDAFELWMEENTSNSSVKTTLEEINSIDQSLEQTLETKFQNLSVNVGDVDGVLHLLKELRNFNAHGEAHTQAVGSLVVTLSCLVFWDSIIEDDYEDMREAVDSTYLGADREYSGWMYGFFPHGFYPLNEDIMREPEPGKLNSYIIDGHHVIRFGEGRDLVSVRDLLLRFEEDEMHEFLEPTEFVITTDEFQQEEEDKRLNIEFDEGSSFEVVYNTIDAVLEKEDVEPDEVHPVELWLLDTRPPEED